MDPSDYLQLAYKAIEGHPDYDELWKLVCEQYIDMCLDELNGDTSTNRRASTA